MPAIHFSGIFYCFNSILPNINIIKLITAQPHITAAIGIAVPLFKTLTIAVAIAPSPNCSAPIKADAVPAFLEKGASVSADEFGNAKP